MPPEVTVPTTPSRRVEQVRPPKPTRSFSICSRLGNAVGSSPLEPANARDRLAADPVDLGQPGVVDVGEGAAAVHGQVAGLQLGGGEARSCGVPGACSCGSRYSSDLPSASTGSSDAARRRLSSDERRPAARENPSGDRGQRRVRLHDRRRRSRTR